MDVSERRIIGALLLLLGVSFLVLSSYTGHLSDIVELLKTPFQF